jgi:FtsZ-binding cell division protein ZapB
MEREFTFIEAAIGDGFRLDADAGVAYGVAVCGPVSLNGRDYPDAVRDRDKGLYEGSQVYIDHKDGERNVREWFGELKNPRTRLSDRRTIADHHYPKNSAFTAEYEERANKFPRSLGFSHVAVCKTKRVNGREVIEAIQRVHSVDLVARPATNKSIHESITGGDMEEKEKAELMAKITEAIDKIKQASDDNDKLREQLKTLAAERDSLKTAHDKLVTEGEQLKLAALIGDAKLSDVQRKAVGLLSDEADRKALVESFKQSAQGERPKSGEQNAAKTESAVPTDGKAFAESLKRSR